MRTATREQVIDPSTIHFERIMRKISMPRPGTEKRANLSARFQRQLYHRSAPPCAPTHTFGDHAINGGGAIHVDDSGDGIGFHVDVVIDIDEYLRVADWAQALRTPATLLPLCRTNRVSAIPLQTAATLAWTASSGDESHTTMSKAQWARTRTRAARHLPSFSGLFLVGITTETVPH
jgi:hypothetical protein